MATKLNYEFGWTRFETVACLMKNGFAEAAAVRHNRCPYEIKRRPLSSVPVPQPRFRSAGTARRPSGRISVSAGVGHATSVGDRTHRGSKECADGRNSEDTGP